MRVIGEGAGWVTPGLRERPPVEGWDYVAFAVHPTAREPITAVAIAHAEGNHILLDAVRENISVADCCALLHRYGIAGLTGGLDEGGDDGLMHAVAGATTLAAKQARSRS
jgi:hypothetical protein